MDRAGATSGDTILVTDGSFKPDQGSGQVAGVRTSTFQLITGVTMQGGFASCGAPNPDARDITGTPTILSGDLSDNDTPVACTVNSPDCDYPFNSPGFCVDDFRMPSRNSGENSYHVVSGSGTGTTAEIDGFAVDETVA